LNVTVVETDVISVTTFNRTGQQSLATQVFSDVTISQITSVSEQFNTPVTVVTDGNNNLQSGDRVTINGGGCPDLDGKNFYVEVINPTTVQLYYDNGLAQPVLLFNTNPLRIGGTSYIQAIIDDILNQPDRYPLLLNQPDYTLYDTNRLWVTVERSAGVRNYIAPEYLRIVDNVLAILMPIEPADTIVVTSMTPSASPTETRLRINNTWNTLTNTANTPQVYRENQNTRTFLTESSEIVDDEFTVFDPYKLVKILSVAATVPSSGDKYIDVQGVNTSIITSIVVESGSTEVTDYETSIINNSIIRLTFTGSTTGAVQITIALGNTVMINSEQITFTNIDLVSGVVSGLKRGMTGTITNETLTQYSSVQSVLVDNQLSPGYYNEFWYNITNTGGDPVNFTNTIPLQLTRNTIANFLNQEV
jgi:hypothetical protein